MNLRQSLTGTLAAAVAGAALVAVAGPAAAADPDDTPFVPISADVIGAGSDTSQHALFLLASAYNSSTPTPTARLATFAATGGGTITLPSGTIDRPNGSGAGKALLYGAGNNTDIDYARSSSGLSTNEVNANLYQFPFALDTLQMAVSATVPSNAPASLTPAQIVDIYSGEVTNWNEIGGAAGAIAPKIPQSGSGTRSFFVGQLTAMNGGTPVALAASVAEVQEHDDTPVRSNANAIAPFSVGRSALLGPTLRLADGWEAKRALYNVVRSGDLGNGTIQALFGEDGFVCSDDARDLILEAGFDQLAGAEDDGVCGIATQSSTTNFTTSEAAEVITTSTRLAGVSPAARTARLVATVTAEQQAQGTVSFFQVGSETPLGTSTVAGGQATLTVAGAAPGARSFSAAFTPAEDSPFEASTSPSTSVLVKTSSALRATFPAKVKAGKRAKGSVVATLAGVATKATGRLTLSVGNRRLSAVLKSGRATLTLPKLKAGKNRVAVSWAGDASATGSSTTFVIKQAKPKKKQRG